MLKLLSKGEGGRWDVVMKSWCRTIMFWRHRIQRTWPLCNCESALAALGSVKDTAMVWRELRLANGSGREAGG